MQTKGPNFRNDCTYYITNMYGSIKMYYNTTQDIN